MSGHNTNGRSFNRSAPYQRKQHQGNFNHNNSRLGNQESSEWEHQTNSYPQSQGQCNQNNLSGTPFPNIPPPNPGYQNANTPNGYYGPPGYNFPMAQNFPFPPPMLPPQALAQMHQQFFPGAPLPPLPPGQPQNRPPPLGYYPHPYLAQNCYPHFPPPPQPWFGGYLPAQPYPQPPVANYQPPMANAYLVPPMIPALAPATRPDLGQFRNNGHSLALKPAAPVTPPKNRLSFSPQLPGGLAMNEKPRTCQPKPHVFPIEPTPKDLPSPSPACNVGPTELYEKIAQIGEGSYGKVYKAKNLQTQNFVALKCLRLENEREGFPLTALREIKLLQKLRDKRIVQLLEILTIDKSIYMVFEYMDYDLSGFLTHPASIIKPKHITHLMCQLLQGLAYLHTNDIVHRDLKGSNLLLDKKGNLKIADFGLARILDQKRNRDYTNRVITLWYRPPELLLGSTNYGNEVDLWGAGCIMLEMFLRTPAFPGKDEIGQLDLIYRCLGTPSPSSWIGIEDLPWYQLLLPVECHAPSFRSSFSSIVPSLALDLVEQMLAMCPNNRISARGALNHLYFKNYEPHLEDFPTLEGDWHEYEVKILQRKELSHKSPS